VALRTDDTRVVSPLRIASDVCAGDTRGLSKPFVYILHARMRMYDDRNGEKGLEKGDRNREKERGREGGRERDIRMQRRMSGVPLLRSRYNA